MILLILSLLLLKIFLAHDHTVLRARRPVSWECTNYRKERMQKDVFYTEINCKYFFLGKLVKVEWALF